MIRILYISAAALLLSCAWGVVRVSEAVRKSVLEAPKMLANSVEQSADRLANRTADSVDAAAERLERQIRAARIDLTRTAATLPGLVDTHAGKLEAIADRRLGEALASVGVAAASVQDVALRAGPVLNHAAVVMENSAALTAQVNDVAPLFLDCQGNPSCAYNLFQGIAKNSQTTAQETALTMREIRLATPQITASVAQTTANVARITKPDSWPVRIAKIAGPAVGGAVLGWVNK